jgi:hypothetical protein
MRFARCQIIAVEKRPTIPTIARMIVDSDHSMICVPGGCRNEGLLEVTVEEIVIT